MLITLSRRTAISQSVAEVYLTGVALLRTVSHRFNIFNTCMDIGLAVNAQTTNFMELPRHSGMMANEHLTLCSNAYEKMKNFKYLGSLLKNQNSIHEEMKCRLKPGNSCYYSFKTLSFPRNSL